MSDAVKNLITKLEETDALRTITFEELEKMDLSGEQKTAIQEGRIAAIHNEWIGDRAQRRERERGESAELYTRARLDVEFLLANIRRGQRVLIGYQEELNKRTAVALKALAERDALAAKVKALEAAPPEKKIELATSADLRRIERGR